MKVAMSVVMPSSSSMELPAGPTAGLLPCKAEADDHQEAGGGGGGGARPLMVNGFLGRRRHGDSSGSSSSIGVLGDSSESSGSEEEDETEVQSKFRSPGPLRTLGLLEDSLPIKRGLSSHFSGKSKSFASLADVVTKPTATASDLAKPENPFNKRRRVLMMAKRSQWPRRASCSALNIKGDGSNDDDDYDLSTTVAAARLPPLPLRPLREEDGEGEESYDDPSSTSTTSRMAAAVAAFPVIPPRRLSLEGSGSDRPMLSSSSFSSSYRSPRSFSLTDLQKHQYTANDFD